MIQALINAEAECTEWIDVKPDKVLMPHDHIDNEWKVVGEFQAFRYRKGNVAYYERFNEVEYAGKETMKKKEKKKNACEHQFMPGIHITDEKYLYQTCGKCGLHQTSKIRWITLVAGRK